jgi:hypothetical protein
MCLKRVIVSISYKNQIFLRPINCLQKIWFGKNLDIVASILHKMRKVGLAQLFWLVRYDTLAFQISLLV